MIKPVGWLLALAFLGEVGAAFAFAQLPPADIAPSPSHREGPASLQPYQKLLPFLPEPPEGWGAEAPSGSTTDSGEIRITTVRRSYYRKDGGEDAPVAVVTIIDSITNADWFGSGEEEWPNSSETDEGFDRRVVIDGMRGLEHYSKAARTGSLSVFVGNRYFVQIELTNENPSALRRWLERIDVKKLAALK